MFYISYLHIYTILNPLYLPNIIYKIKVKGRAESYWTREIKEDDQCALLDCSTGEQCLLKDRNCSEFHGIICQMPEKGNSRFKRQQNNLETTVGLTTNNPSTLQNVTIKKKKSKTSGNGTTIAINTTLLENVSMAEKSTAAMPTAIFVAGRRNDAVNNSQVIQLDKDVDKEVGTGEGESTMDKKQAESTEKLAIPTVPDVRFVSTTAKKNGATSSQGMIANHKIILLVIVGIFTHI